MPKVMDQAVECDPHLKCDSLMEPLFLEFVLDSMIKSWFPALMVVLLACHQLLKLL